MLWRAGGAGNTREPDVETADHTPALVTGEEIRQLPRLARVALAARAARCVFPLYLLHSEWDWVGREELDRIRRGPAPAIGEPYPLPLRVWQRARTCPGAVETAITLAEGIGGGARPLGEMETARKDLADEVRCRDARLDAEDDERQPWVVVCAAVAQAALSALKTGYGALPHPELVRQGTDPSQFARTFCAMGLANAEIAASHGGKLTRYHETATETAVSLVRQDYMRVREAASREGWTDDTRVSPEFFGPCWTQAVFPGAWGLVVSRYASLQATTRDTESRLDAASPILDDLRQGGRVEFGRAPDLCAEVLPGPERAAALRDRHNSLIRSAEIARAILRLDEIGDRAPLNSIAIDVLRSGAFLMWYHLEKLVDRLTSPLWVVTESLGRQVYRDRPAHGELIRAGDCQCQLPRDAADAVPVVTLPDVRDGGDTVVHGAKAIDRIRACPAIAGSVEDLCSERQVARLGFAGESRDRAFAEIRGLPRHFPIRYMTAELFCIKGVRRPNGSVVLLSEFDPPVGDLVNAASYFAHIYSKRHPAFHGWTLRERNVDVTLDEREEPGPYTLIADWLVLVHDLGLAGR